MTPTKSFKLQKDVLLAPFTTLRTGGPARFFVKAECEQQVIEAFDFARENQLQLFVLGGGSNILVADSGFEGLVLQVALKGMSEPSAVADGLTWRETIQFEGDLLQPPATAVGSDMLITAGAGEDWDLFVYYCVENDLAGIECLSGIPGFVGGTPVQNVGAYGQEVSESIVNVRCFDRSRLEIVELSNADCGFSYRKSIFNTTRRDEFIVLSVTYALKKGGAPKIVYKDLQDHLAEKLRARRPQDSRQDAGVTLMEARDGVLQIRAAKSMVIDENDPNSKSAGSFFKNPIVPNETIAEISIKMQIEDIPHFKMDEQTVKIPAAWLIERSGFQKGFRLGNAGISTKHSLAIINCGGASAEEILNLKEKIQSEVEARFGILLQPEPCFVGFE